MTALLATFGAVFLVTFLARPAMGAGWYWDTGNGIGFAAFAGMLYLTLTSIRQFDLRAHRLLGYGVLTVAALHVFWFLLGDAAVVEFLKPGAPAYMWHGVAGFLLLGVLITIALVPDRLRVHRNYAGFRYWHRAIAVATIATATYHIAGSHFYLATWYQTLLFAALAAFGAFARAWWPWPGALHVVGTRAFVATSLAVAAAFGLLRNLPA